MPSVSSCCDCKQLEWLVLKLSIPSLCHVDIVSHAFVVVKPADDASEQRSGRAATSADFESHSSLRRIQNGLVRYALARVFYAQTACLLLGFAEQ